MQTRLADGIYDRVAIHGDGIFPGTASQLATYLPFHDERYEAVEVSGGVVVGVKMAQKAVPVSAEPAPEVAPKPVLNFSEVPDNLNAINYMQLKGIAKRLGLSGEGTRLEIVERLEKAKNG